MDVFVFGSNLAGRHGKGAALHALKTHGAIYGKGEGIQGNSYAIPTRDFMIRTLSIDAVKFHISKFIKFASENPHMTFNLTPIGCGLAGYKQEQMKPLFEQKPDNVVFTKEWHL